MENSMLVTLSHQGVLRRHLDAIAHNIANMNTTGFKAERMMFVEHLAKTGIGPRDPNGSFSLVRDLATVRDLRAGEMRETGNPFDVAIQSDGYFVVETPMGEQFTRNGRFRLDDTGRLVTEHGMPVLTSVGAPVFMSPADTQLTISSDGMISTENGELGQLRIVDFDNPQTLRGVQGGLMTTDEAPIDVTEPLVAQGMLEESNVAAIVETTRMIDLQRAYDSARRLTERDDDRVRKMMQTYVS